MNTIFEKDVYKKTRPVFVAKTEYPFFKISMVTFDAVSGKSKNVKIENAKLMHDAFYYLYGYRPMEISSIQRPGFDSFTLKKNMPSKAKSISIECIYHASKFWDERHIGRNISSGCYDFLLDASPKKVRSFKELSSSGNIQKFLLDGVDYIFPANPNKLFFIFLYVNAILENECLKETLLEFSAFTNINSNSNFEDICDAQAAAIFVGMYKSGKIELAQNPEKFYTELLDEKGGTKIIPLKQGDKVEHKSLGCGEVVSVLGDSFEVEFANSLKKLFIYSCFEDYFTVIK